MRLSGFAEKEASAYLPTSSSEHFQIGAGTLGGEIGVMPLERGALRRVRFTLDMRLAATLQPDCINLVFALDVADGTRVSGLKVATGAIVVIDEGTFTDSRLNAGTTWIAMRLPRGDFMQRWAAQTSRDLPWHAGLATAAPADAERDALASTLAALERIARSQPELFDEPLWRRNVERALEARFLSSLQSALDALDDRFGRAGRELVRRANEYLETSDDPVCTVPDLCTALEVGRRRLERAFNDTLGLGPKEYLQLRSLTAAREALLDPAQVDLTVTSIAMQQGFWHLGRFSLVYAAHFGELPRETRRRTLAKVMPGKRAA